MRKAPRIYRRVSNLKRTWVGNEIVDHSDVVGASPVGAAPTTSLFSTEHLASIYCAKTTASQVEKHFWDLVCLILQILRYLYTLPWNFSCTRPIVLCLMPQTTRHCWSSLDGHPSLLLNPSSDYDWQSRVPAQHRWDGDSKPDLIKFQE